MSVGLQPGTIFAGRYRVVRGIAAGGMGAVYEVVHLETERRRALKVMLPHILQSEDLRERFQREAKVAAHIDSDFIVDVFDAGYDDETRMPFLVMELLRGEELGKRLKRLGRLAPAEVVTYLHQTALALDKTHKASIVHRDLKPENLFLNERDDGPPRVKVLDFGIAKVVAESTTGGGATQSIGTPLYMAPEQFNPHARLTGAADLYALAMVAYTLLVGAAYWGEETRAGNVLALAMVAVQGPREPASARAARRGVTLPPSFDAWFARSTLVDPAQRFPTAVDMVAALAQALGLPPPARGPQTSFSGVSDFQAASGSFAAPASSPSLGAPASSVPSPSATVTSSGTVYVTAPALSTSHPVPVAPRSKAPVLLAALGAAVLALAGAAAFVFTRGPTARPASPGASATAAAIPATAAPTATAASPAASAPEPTPAPPTVEPAATVSAAPAATAATAKTAAPPSAKPVATAAPASTSQRRKMWGRD